MQKVSRIIEKVFKKPRLESFENQTVQYNTNLAEFEKQTKRYYTNLYDFEKKAWIESRKNQNHKMTPISKLDYAKFIEYDGSNEFENCHVYIDDYKYCRDYESDDDDSTDNHDYDNCKHEDCKHEACTPNNYYEGIGMLMDFLGKKKMSINQFVLTELKESHLSGFYCEMHDCESMLENENETVFYVNEKVYCDYCVKSV